MLPIPEGREGSQQEEVPESTTESHLAVCQCGC